MSAIASLFFAERKDGPERLVCEAEVHFDDGPLAGTRLLGFSLWRDDAGELFVTFPSRATGAGTERRYFDYLRSLEGKRDSVRRIKAWILDQYRTEQARQAVREESVQENVRHSESTVKEAGH